MEKLSVRQPARVPRYRPFAELLHHVAQILGRCRHCVTPDLPIYMCLNRAGGHGF
jgi:hypothetical protein